MTRRSYLAGATMLAIAAAGLAPLSVAGSQSPAAATARTVPALFGTASATAQRTAPDLSLGAAKRSRYVSFRAGVLPRTAAGQRISLGFFKDATFIGNVEHVDRQPLLTSWSGPLNSQYGTFVVTKSGDRYSVMASTTSGSYSMSMTRSGSYQVEEVSPPHLTADDEFTPAPDAASSDKAAAERRKKVRGGDDGSIEDILVLYTAQAAAAYGGVAGINAEAAKNIGYTNAAYAASGVTTTARLVGVLQTSTTENGDLSVDLPHLYTRGDGYFDDVFGFIKQTHADDTMLIEKPYTEGAFCGLASFMHNQPANRAFATLLTGECTNAYPTFPHELGHDQGLLHDYYAEHDGGIGSDSSKPQYPFGYGYVAPDCSFRTIMSYADKCESQIGQYIDPLFQFANPAVAYNGQPTGTAAQSDTALAISKTKKVVARHQQSQLYPRGGKVAIKPKPRVGQRVHVTFKGWINGGVHTKFQWYRNGKPIKHAKHATYRPTRKDGGKQLSVVVKGKKKYYTPVLIGTNARKVKGPGKKHGHHRATAPVPLAPAAASFVVPNARGSVL